jgi:hypothetical protein
MRNIHPLIYGVLALLIGIGLAVGGVYLLAGLGWSLIAGAVPCLLFAGFLFRGLVIAQAVAAGEGDDEAQ